MANYRNSTTDRQTGRHNGGQTTGTNGTDRVKTNESVLE